MIDGSDGASHGRIPLSSIENVITKKSVGIPKLKSSSIKRSASKENITTSTYDKLRNLIEIYVYDGAAVAQANSYISELQKEAIVLRNNLTDLENSLRSLTAKHDIGQDSKLMRESATLDLALAVKPVGTVDSSCDNVGGRGLPLTGSIVANDISTTNEIAIDASPVSTIMGVSKTPQSTEVPSVAEATLVIVNSLPTEKSPVQKMRRSNRRASMSATAVSDASVFADDSSTLNESKREKKNAGKLKVTSSFGSIDMLLQQEEVNTHPSLIKPDRNSSPLMLPSATILSAECNKDFTHPTPQNVLACKDIEVVETAALQSDCVADMISEMTALNIDDINVPISACTRISHVDSKDNDCHQGDGLDYFVDDYYPIDYEAEESYGGMVFDCEEAATVKKSTRTKKDEKASVSRRTSSRFKVRPSRFLDNETEKITSIPPSILPCTEETPALPQLPKITRRKKVDAVSCKKGQATHNAAQASQIN